MQGAIFCYPEKILTSPLWDNPIILRNNKPLKTSAFPTLSEKIKTPADLYINGTESFAPRPDLEEKFNVEITEEDLRELHYIVRITNQTLGVKPGTITEPYYPTQPLLIQIANLTRSGCSSYYKLLRKKLTLSNTTKVREAKWHSELECTFGVEYWGKT